MNAIFFACKNVAIEKYRYLLFLSFKLTIIVFPDQETLAYFTRCSVEFPVSKNLTLSGSPSWIRRRSP